MANVLTGMRIICGLLILCFPAFSGWYYCFYLIGGFTDAIDGTIARKMGTASDFGSKFDTVADFIFAVAVVIRIMQALTVPAKPSCVCRGMEETRRPPPQESLLATDQAAATSHTRP